jgi:ATP-binding cassette subfamily C protein
MPKSPGLKKFLAMLTSLAQTLTFTCHHPREIDRADWIVLLDQGKLLLQGSLEDLRFKPGDYLDFLTP